MVVPLCILSTTHTLFDHWSTLLEPFGQGFFSSSSFYRLKSKYNSAEINVCNPSNVRPHHGLRLEQFDR